MTGPGRSMSYQVRFLLTNDDGAHAEGLQALRRAVANLGPALTIAPHEHVSGCSHQATTHRPLELTELDQRWFMLDGSPVDCTRVGLCELAPDVEWVISGINEGGNLGVDVYLSGTVAAAREACLMGRQAIASSQYHRRGPIDWATTEGYAAAVLPVLISRPLPPGRFWNVNLPHTDGPDMPEHVYSGLDLHALPVRYEKLNGRLQYVGSYHERKRSAGSDVEVCFGGRISITEIAL